VATSRADSRVSSRHVSLSRGVPIARPGPLATAGMPRAAFDTMAASIDSAFSNVDRPARIIVAEDDREMRRLVADSLREDGYEVHEVADGAELMVRLEDAFFLNRTPPIDLFVTDIRMPGHTVMHIVSSLRGAGVHVPGVIITAFGNTETRDQAAALGAELLEKPFKMGALRALVRYLLRQRFTESDRHS
jgi:DNA-binding response OmpR family regulator